MTRYALSDNCMRRISTATFDTVTEAILFAEASGLSEYTVVPVSSDGKRLAVQHLDGNPGNNDLANLAIVDVAENRRGMRSPAEK
jgi:hypothetical protein